MQNHMYHMMFFSTVKNYFVIVLLGGYFTFSTTEITSHDSMCTITIIWPTEYDWAREYDRGHILSLGKRLTVEIHILVWRPYAYTVQIFIYFLLPFSNLYKHSHACFNLATLLIMCLLVLSWDKLSFTSDRSSCELLWRYSSQIWKKNVCNRFHAFKELI